LNIFEVVEKREEELMSLGGNMLCPVKKGVTGSHFIIKDFNNGINRLMIIIKQE
jgi:hypothetical protein